jgi:D-amino-acid dehydrogenase
MLPDGPPLLGATRYPNLFLNLGHGSTGWAMACGSGQVVADVISDQTPAIDLDGLTLARYSAN